MGEHPNTSRAINISYNFLLTIREKIHIQHRSEATPAYIFFIGWLFLLKGIRYLNVLQ